MKQLLPFLFFLFLSFQISAQGEFTVEPNPNVESFQLDLGNNDTETLMHSIFINNYDEFRRVKWTVTLQGANCPAEWEYKVCDANNCYVWGVLTNEGGPVDVAVELMPGDTSRLDLYYKPNGIKGCCTPVIHLRDFDAPTDILATASYDVCIDDLTTSVTEQEKVSLKVYPNPTADYISISTNDFVEELWISNILGKRVRNFKTNVGNSYDVSMLPDGIYLVSMVDKSNKVMKTVRISKRAIRP
ncbi:MAG: T9SS type A sorting domain-containing protein [Bacteroidota bacterium]